MDHTAAVLDRDPLSYMTHPLRLQAPFGGMETLARLTSFEG